MWARMRQRKNSKLHTTSSHKSTTPTKQVATRQSLKRYQTLTRSSAIRANDNSMIWIEVQVPVPIHTAGSDEHKQINIRGKANKRVIRSRNSNSNKPIRTSRALLSVSASDKSKKSISKDGEGRFSAIVKGTITSTIVTIVMGSTTPEIRVNTSGGTVHIGMSNMERLEISKTSSGACRRTFAEWKKKRSEDTKSSSITTGNTGEEACTTHSIRRSRIGIQSSG